MKLAMSLLIIFVLMTSTTFAEEKLPTISVNGEGVVEVSPDRATISIGVVNRDKDSARAQSANAKAASEVIRAVIGLGVDKKNIRTGNYSFRQLFRNDANRNRMFEGYEVNNTVTIIVDDLSLVGKVIDSSLSHGANSIESLEFGIRDRTALENEALKLAVNNARAKAEVVAASLGKSIVGVRSVSINSGNVSAPRFAKVAMAVNEAADYQTPIESGTLNCSASVHIEFEISR